MDPRISIKNETETPPARAMGPPQQHLIYGAQYSHKMPLWPPVEMPGRDAHMYRSTNMPYQCDMPPGHCSMCRIGAGACLPEYIHYLPSGTQYNLPVTMVTPNLLRPKPRNRMSKAK